MECRERWNAVRGATGYAVYRNSQLIKELAGITYTNAGLFTGKTYTYTIRAYKTVNKKMVYGSYSAKVSIVTQMSEAQKLAARIARAKAIGEDMLDTGVYVSSNSPLYYSASYNSKSSVK